MALDPNIPLEAGRPSGPFGPNMAQVYAAQNQSYKNYLQNQDIAGQNALSGVFANQNNLNPATGLPTPQAMAPVLATNPQLGLDYLAAMQKMEESRQRSGIANFGIIQKYNQSYDQSVAGPALEYNQQLLQQNLPPEQRQILYDQKKKELTDSWQKSHGVPDQIVNAVSSPEPPETTAFKSETFKKQQDNIQKGWSEPQVDDAGNTFFYNKHTGGAYLNQDLSKPYQVVGNVRKAEPEKTPESFVDVTKAGPVYGITKNPATGLLMKDGAPYEPVGTLQKLGAKGAGAEAAPKQAENISVRRPDGKIEPVVANEIPGQAGQPSTFKDLKGNVIDPNTIVTTKVPAGVAQRPQYDDTYVNVIAQQAMTGDPAALRNVWGGAELRVQVGNAIGQQALKQWGEFARVRGDDGKVNKIQIHRDESDPSSITDDSGAKIDPSKIVEAGIPSPTAGANLAAINAVFSGEEGAARNLLKLKSNVENFERTALGEAKIALDLSGKGLAGSVPALNRWIQAGRKSLGGDEDVAALDAAVTSLANEYAKVMSSPGATGAVTSDTARAEARSIINRADTPEMFRKTIDTMERSMHNRVNKINEQIGATVEDIKAGGGVNAPLTKLPNPLEQPATPSSGAAGASAPLPGFDRDKQTNHDTVDDAKAKITPTVKPWAIDNHGKMEYWKKFPDGVLRQTDTNGKPLQ